DPSKEHEPEVDDEDPEEDPNEEHESKGSDDTEPFKEDKIADMPPPSRHRGARIYVIPQTPMAASTQALIDAFASGSSPFPICTYWSPTWVAEDASYVRALQASERRMMTSIEEVNLRVSYQAQIDVVRGERTAYETELQEVHQAYLSSEALNRELLARLETLETHMSRMEWQRQSAEDLAVTQMMRIHILKARARADTVEDVDSGPNRL
nr:hypothetical protein [Tanacetum cinerariifolium]